MVPAVTPVPVPLDASVSVMSLLLTVSSVADQVVSDNSRWGFAKVVTVIEWLPAVASELAVAVNALEALFVTWMLV
jgi:hypothetical protein